MCTCDILLLTLIITQYYYLKFLFLDKYVYFFLSFFCLFRATPVPHGGSQARDPIGAVVAGLRHSHSSEGSELHLRPTPQLTATQYP